MYTNLLGSNLNINNPNKPPPENITSRNPSNSSINTSNYLKEPKN
jgi:hypothetical protein